ncbi:MAG: menaquinone biosynthesis protein [Acidobacteriota bacterium]|nr:menaquinone biosynthesis protein [Blastocatellia bacterium]MDW8411082.1 menaquinone biosynthesis protein [Acidobacteriota bacterium]
MKDAIRPAKIAASTYLNSAPLVYGFLRGSQRNRCKFYGNQAPASCAESLAIEEVDAALIPSIEYAKIQGLRVVPSIAVASRNSVMSVLLVARRPIYEISSVALDSSSRTSVALVKILLERFYEVRPRYSKHEPSLELMLQDHDAALLIGDPAITANKTGLYVYDLATEWHKFTALPFVFAFWAVGRHVEARLSYDIASKCIASKEEGLLAREAIVREYSEKLGLDSDSLKKYITENIDYDLDEDKIEGLGHFYHLACKVGIISSIPKLQMLRL